MTFVAFLTILPALFGLGGVQSAAAQPGVRTMTIEQQVIMRVPVRPWIMPRAIEWIERKGPKCIPTAEIRGAALSGPDHVDFLLVDRRRVRAELDDDCPTLDFYGGFYLKPEDDRLCSDRDAIHSRIGGSCTIDRFRRLEPKLRQ